MYSADILKITDEVLKARVMKGISNVACFSLQTNIPTKASAAHTVMRGLTNLLGLKNFTGIDVPSLKGGSGGAVATVVEAPKEAPKDDKKGGKDDKKGGKKEEKKKEPEPEPEDEGFAMGDLFG